MIFCLSSGDQNLSLGISLSCSFVTVSELFNCKFCETFVILLPIKSLAASAVFDITLLYYYIIIISDHQQFLVFFSGDVYLFLGFRYFFIIVICNWL